MAQLSAPNMLRYRIGDLGEATMAAAAVIWKGAALGFTGNNTVRPLVALDKFAGFADDSYDTTKGSVVARFKKKGQIVLTVAGLAANTAVGTSVYASDDHTFTLTSTGNSLIGKIASVDDATHATVAFNAALI